MPNIRQYEPPQEGLRPQEIGVEATAAAARRGGAFFNQAGQSIASAGQQIGSALSAAGKAATDYETHREVSAGAAQFATMEAGFTSAWNNTVSRTQLDPKDPRFLDPNSPAVAQQFRASMQPSFNQFKDSFITEDGRNWAEQHVDRFREHMLAKTTSDIGQIAANAVSYNAQKMRNEQTNRVYADPSALEDAITSWRSSTGAIIGSSPTIEATKKSSLKLEFAKDEEQFVKAAIVGTIAKGGDWRPIAEKYSQYVSQPEMAQFERKEQQQERAERTNERYNNYVDKQERQATSDDRQREILTKLREDPRSISATDALNDPRLTPAAQRQMATRIDAFTKGGPPEGRSRTNFRNMVELIAKPEDDPEHVKGIEELNDTVIRHDVKWNHYLDLVKELDASKTPDGQRILQAKVEAFNNINRADTFAMTERAGAADQRFYDYNKDVNRKIEAARASGKDPMDLFDRTKPEYVGNNPAYYTTLTRQMREQARNPIAPTVVPAPAKPSALPPRNPGESLTDWLVRSGRGLLP